MELSLKGSQINLATRDRPAPNNNSGGGSVVRPGSACVLTRRKKHQVRPAVANRPLSADTAILNKAKSSETSDKKKYTSSSNLLKLLISEPVPKPWVSSLDSDTKSESSFDSKPKQQNNLPPKKVENLPTPPKAPKADDSSMDEDPSNLRKLNAKPASDPPLAPGVAKKPPLPLRPVKPYSFNSPPPNLNNNRGILKPEVRLEDRRYSSYQSWVNENVKKKNLDLPGRVSFSHNDVYEIDYSDYEDRDSESHKSSDSMEYHSKSRNHGDDGLKPSDSDSHTDDPGTDAENGCCPGNCTSYFKQKALPLPSPKQSPAKDDADKILAEYRREIEDLKRRHEFNPYLPRRASSLEDAPRIVEEPPKLIVEEMPRESEGSKDIQGPSSDPIKDYLETVEKMVEDDLKKHEDNHSLLPMKLNNLWGQENKLVPISIEKPRLDTSNPVIKNYLKAKDEEPLKVSTRILKRPNNEPSKKPKKEIPPKPKSANGTRSKLSPVSSSSSSQGRPMKRSKSIPSLRDDRNLDEFEIDKVVSWMSIHDDNFSDQGSMNQLDAIKDCKKEWSTPAGKRKSRRAEDEGTFSVDETTVDDTDSPYEEIVSVIKEIEREKRDPNLQTLKSDVEFKLNTLLSSIESPDSAISDDDKNSEENGKIKEIFSYLDEVDTKCDKTLENLNKVSDDSRTDIEFAFEPDIVDDIPKIDDLLMLTNHQLCRKIINLSLRVNELNNAIQLSKEHVSNVRGEKLKAVRLEKQNTQKRLNEQKKHYEEIVAKHQTFIEGLLKDKATLCEKVTAMGRRLDSQNQAWEHRLKTEVERSKETVLAGEKIRREKWVRENTKKIKELTVKGLEMEINKMTASHQKEVVELKQQHQRDLIEMADEMKRKYEEKEKTLRDSYARDREGAIEKERQAILERFEKQIEDERKLFEQQKQRLIKELEDEKDRVYKEVQSTKEQFDARKERIKCESMDLLHQAKAEFKEKLRQRDIKHQNDMKKLEEQFESDFALWKRDFEQTMKLRESEREHYIREQCRIERDRQIDSIVAKVDAEGLKNQQEFEIKMSRTKDKYERELKELEASESALREKYAETKSRLADCEANIANLQLELKQMESQWKHCKKLCDEYMAEKDMMKHEARREIQVELKNVQKERDTEIQRIYSRVQQAIEKKDSTLETLQKENIKLRERCLKLDTIVRQQRKDYCTK